MSLSALIIFIKQGYTAICCHSLQFELKKKNQTNFKIHLLNVHNQLKMTRKWCNKMSCFSLPLKSTWYCIHNSAFLTSCTSN